MRLQFFEHFTIAGSERPDEGRWEGTDRNCARAGDLMSGAGFVEQPLEAESSGIVQKDATSSPFLMGQNNNLKMPRAHAEKLSGSALTPRSWRRGTLRIKRLKFRWAMVIWGDTRISRLPMKTRKD